MHKFAFSENFEKNVNSLSVTEFNTESRTFLQIMHGDKV